MNRVLTQINDVALTPRIYVTCLASYREGISHGVWIDADLQIELIKKKIQWMLSKSPVLGAEEYAIYSFEGFYELWIGEDEHLDSVQEKALFIMEHGELGAKLAACYGEGLEKAREALANHYQGKYESELDFARELFDEHYLPAVPENVQPYIDYEAFCRDIFTQDYFSLTLDSDDSCHVFRTH